MKEGAALILNKDGQVNRASQDHSAVSQYEQQNMDSKYVKKPSLSRNSTDGIPFRSVTIKEDINQSIGALVMNRRGLTKRGVMISNTRDALKS